MDAKDAINKGRLVYTCKCGWIDTGHADPKSTRPTVGPAFLWEQIIKESGRKSVNPRINGFQVTYTQDAVWSIWGRKSYPGVTRNYLVVPGLSKAEKESVALAIFREVSFAFEEMQGLAFWSGSSFSIEDLVSNLLSFYSIVRPKTDYLKLCEPIGKQESLKLLEQYSDTFSSSNRNFLPIYYNCDACPCSGPFPPELQAIIPAKKGVHFKDWIEMYEYSGRPPLKSGYLKR